MKDLEESYILTHSRLTYLSSKITNDERKIEHQNLGFLTRKLKITSTDGHKRYLDALYIVIIIVHTFIVIKIIKQ